MCIVCTVHTRRCRQPYTRAWLWPHLSLSALAPCLLSSVSCCSLAASASRAAAAACLCRSTCRPCMQVPPAASVSPSRPRFYPVHVCMRASAAHAHVTLCLPHTVLTCASSAFCCLLTAASLWPASFACLCRSASTTSFSARAPCAAGSSILTGCVKRACATL